MGFTSKSKDWGIGVRGPYGRMQSGGERLGNLLQNWASEERDSGVNKAITAASARGQITPAMMIEISDNWKVPLPAVMARAKPINDELETHRLKNLGQSLYLRFTTFAEENPGVKPKQAQMLEWIKEGNGTEADLAFAMGVLQKTIQAKDVKHFTLKQGDQFYQSIGGKKPEMIAENPKPEKTPEPSDFLRAYRQHVATPGNEKVTMSQFKTKYWQPTSEKSSSKVPEFYYEDVSAGLDAIQKGADPGKIYNKLVKLHKTKVKELKTLILDVGTLPPLIKKELQQTVALINLGKIDKKKAYSELAAKYEVYRDIFNDVIKPTSTSDETLQAIANLLK